ncbi:MAG TPA: VWA domain-containing protein [Thermoanaerobaculia bacterium]|nr:VWA domain-containing protein [Thermoanaerobaculia bacterium]
MRRIPLPQPLRRFGMIAVLLFSCLGSGAPAAAQPQLYGGTTDVVVVEVPVQVVRDGQPVRGLAADDFEIYEGRKKQKITGFEVMDLAAPVPAGMTVAVVPAAARRHFLLLFDLSFSEPKAILKARAAATTVLDQLHPTDLVAVSTYSASHGPQLILGFTSDRGQVEAALENLGMPELINRSGDPLQLYVTAFRDELSQQGGRQASLGKEKDEKIKAWLEDMEHLNRPGELATRRNEVSAFTDSFADLAKMMSSVSGRKHVVYLSEGFDSSILIGTTDVGEIDRMQKEVTEPINKKINSELRFGDSQAIGDFEKMLEQFRRADCVVQSVDIGGLRAGSDLGFERRGGTDTLLAMARDTGGDLYQNFNDLGEAMRQMLERTGVTYILSFQPEEVRRDGAYHDLRVELKNRSRGTRLAHRSGYYAPKPYSQMAPAERQLQAAGQVMSGGDPGLLPTSVLVAPFPGGDRANVPVVVEVDGRALLSGITPGTSLLAEVYVYALDVMGTVHDFTAQTVGLDLAKLEMALLQGGFRFVGHLDLQPGEYSVRVLVRNGVTGASGLRIVPLTVPAAAVQPALLAPFFPQPLATWPTVREAPRAGKAQAAYPFRMKEEPYVPAPRPVLVPGQETRIALIGWHLEGDLRATARITAADGREVGTGEIRLLDRESGETERLAATFRPPSLPPGEYRLAIRLTGAGGSVESPAAPFVIGE